MMPASVAPETPAAALERKLARMEWLRADNAADRFPSFVRILAESVTPAKAGVQGYRTALALDSRASGNDDWVPAEDERRAA